MSTGGFAGREGLTAIPRERGRRRKGERQTDVKTDRETRLPDLSPVCEESRGSLKQDTPGFESQLCPFSCMTLGKLPGAESRFSHLGNGDVS